MTNAICINVANGSVAASTGRLFQEGSGMHVTFL